MKIAVSELIVRFMERLGIEVIFGMPGAHILPVYDGLVDSTIRSVLVKHEQGAAFMAGGYARASGRIGACITTAGPGATNLVTGIANAYADKQPILVITGETSTYIFGKGGLQESSGEGGALDQAALFKGITRYHKIVERTDYLGQVLKQAAKILLVARSGPGAAEPALQRAEGTGRRGHPRRHRLHAPAMPRPCGASRTAGRRTGAADRGRQRSGDRRRLRLHQVPARRTVVAQLSRAAGHPGRHQPQGQGRDRRGRRPCRSAASASPRTARPTATSSIMPTW